MKDNIPDKWEITRLDKFLKINMGQSPPSKSYNENGIGLPFFQGVTEFGDFYPKTKIWCTDPLKVAHPNEILFSVRAPVGEVNLTDSKCCIGRGVSSLHPKNADAKYCFYILKQFKHNFRKYSQGTTYDAINKNDLAQTNLIYTSNILEQEKIALILSNIDSLIQHTQKTIEKTQRLKKGLMQRLLTKGIGHKKFQKIKGVFEKDIEIPEDWDYEKLSTNSTLKGRIGWQGLTTAEYRQTGKFNLVTGTDFKNGRIDWKNCVYVDEERYSQDTNIQLKKGDVLVTKDGTIGKIAYVDTLPSPTTLNTGVFVIRPIDNGYFPLFLYYILNSEYFIKFLNKLKAGSTINHLYQKDFVNFHFPIPPCLEQQKIISIISSVDKRILSEKNYLDKLIRIKSGLMNDLLTGRTRVTA